MKPPVWVSPQPRPLKIKLAPSSLKLPCPLGPWERQSHEGSVGVVVVVAGVGPGGSPRRSPADAQRDDRAAVVRRGRRQGRHHEVHHSGIQGLDKKIKVQELLCEGSKWSMTMVTLVWAHCSCCTNAATVQQWHYLPGFHSNLTFASPKPWRDLKLKHSNSRWRLP